VAHWFARKLKGEDYDVTVVKIEKVAHKLSKQAIQETVEFIRRVSKLTLHHHDLFRERRQSRCCGGLSTTTVTVQGIQGED
jgi:hypothetical protein